MDGKSVRQMKVQARHAVIDAMALPRLDVTKDDVDALLEPSSTLVVDLLYVAHAVRLCLGEWVDETSSNRILILRRLVLAWPQPCRFSELAEWLGVSRQCVSVLVAKMKRENLLVESVDPLHEQGKLVYLTERGLDELRQVTASLHGVGEQILEFQPAERRAPFVADLRELRKLARVFSTDPWARRRYRWKRRRSKSVEEVWAEAAEELDSGESFPCD